MRIGVDDLDRERVDAPFEFAFERLHHRPMLREAGLAGKLRARDSDAEMGLAPFPPTGMPFVSGAFVNDFKMAGSEFLGKFLLYRVANRHRIPGPVGARRN